MAMRNLIDRGPPDATNDQGSKFWLYQTLTDYCHDKGLPKHYVLLCEDNKGNCDYVIMCGRDPIYSNQSLECVACQIDILSFK
jgi:hypothetical protein